MFGIRSFVIASIAMVGGNAAAQFDGPAPLAWRWQQSSPVSPNGTPLVDGNTIYFNLGNRMYAIDRETGNMRWKFPNGAQLSGIVRRSPVMVNGVLCVFTDQKEVYGVNPANGELKWVYQAPFSISGQITAVGGNIAFGMDGGNLMGVDTSNGKPIYDGPYRILDGIRGPVYSDGRDIVAFFDNRNTLQAISLSTKKLAWRQPFGATPPDGSMTARDGSFYVYTGAFMACLNAFSGSVKWQTNVPERMMFSPEVGGNYVLAVSQTGNAYVYDAGGILKLKKPIALGSQPSVRPTFVGKKFIVPTSNGAIQLLDPETGTIDWQYYVRPMNEAARQGSSTGSSGGGLGATGAGGAGGLGAPGGPQKGGGGQPSSGDDQVVTVQVSAPVAISGKTLLVPAADASLLAFDIETGVDLIGPDVKQIWPSAGELVSGKSGQEFIFKVEDQSSGVNIASIKLDIDGQAYNYDFGRDGYLICQISPTKKNNMLSGGRHTLRLVAKDWLGNETVLTTSLRVDNTLDPLKRPGSTTNNPGGPGGKGGPGGFGPGGGGFGPGGGR
jgi:outer membrane protein assembly factor BamB